MKILFVCKANIFRSQMAEAFFKQKCKKHEAKSVGIMIEKENQKIGERSEKNVKFIIAVMKKKGIDISKNKIKGLKPEMAASADRIIFMAKKNSLPRALLKNKKISYWKVRDGASNSTYEFFVKSRDKINKLVGKLVKEIC